MNAMMKIYVRMEGALTQMGLIIAFVILVSYKALINDIV